MNLNCAQEILSQHPFNADRHYLISWDGTQLNNVRFCAKESTELLRNLKNSHYFTDNDDLSSNTETIILAEEVSFLNKGSIRQMLDDVKANKNVIIDASKSTYIDFDVLELIKEFRDIKAPIKNISCNLIGFHEQYNINSALLQSGH